MSYTKTGDPPARPCGSLNCGSRDRNGGDPPSSGPDSSSRENGDSRAREAGREELFERLRRRLVRFFEGRRIGDPEGHAQEVLVRLLGQMDNGAEIRDPFAYALTTARNLLKAQRPGDRHVSSESVLSALTEMPSRGDDVAKEGWVRYVAPCLRKALTKNERELLLKYYADQGAERIQARRRLAEDLGISNLAVRLRITRLRKKLERCIRECIAREGRKP